MNCGASRSTSKLEKLDTVMCMTTSMQMMYPMKEVLTNGKIVYNDPLAWWKTKSVNYPIMASLAMTVLCIPATSAPSERLLSVTVTDNRA